MPIERLEKVYQKRREAIKAKHRPPPFTGGRFDGEFKLIYDAGSDSRQRRCHAPVKAAANFGELRNTQAFSAC